MVNRINYEDLKGNIVNSELVRILFRAMYDTMWCRLGLHDLSLIGGSGKESPGLRYDKGFTYVPRNLISWDAITDEIPTVPFSSKPVTIEEFTIKIEDALHKDLATLIRPATGELEAAISINREIASRLLWTIGSHISLHMRKHGEDGESRAKKLLKSLTPYFLDEYGGRIRVFTASSVCLANLDAYIEELSAHYPSQYKGYMKDAKSPLIGAGGKRLAEPLVMVWSNSLYGERFGGYVLIGGHEERGYITMSLRTIKSAQNILRDSYKDEHLFARYQSATDTVREIVATFTAYKSQRYGTEPKLQFASLISPLDLGLSKKDLFDLTGKSFENYRKILDEKRKEFP